MFSEQYGDYLWLLFMLVLHWPVPLLSWAYLLWNFLFFTVTFQQQTHRTKILKANFMCFQEYLILEEKLSISSQHGLFFKDQKATSSLS